MKVRCIKLLKPDGSDNLERSNGWLTVGNEYTVLSIYGGRQGVPIKYRLIGDRNQNTPAMHDVTQFEIISPDIPSGWTFKLYSDQEWSLEPAAWAKKGFWEAYFDQDKDAQEIFEKEVERIKSRGSE